MARQSPLRRSALSPQLCTDSVSATLSLSSIADIVQKLPRHISFQLLFRQRSRRLLSSCLLDAWRAPCGHSTNCPSLSSRANCSFRISFWVCRSFDFRRLTFCDHHLVDIRRISMDEYVYLQSIFPLFGRLSWSFLCEALKVLVCLPGREPRQL
jgi:hypothetical protein